MARNYQKVDHKIIKEALLGVANEFCDNSGPNVQEQRGEVMRRLKEVLSVLSGRKVSATLLTRRCAKPADEAVEEFQSEHQLDLSDLRQACCVKARLILYREYIEDSIRLMQEYVKDKEAPNKWGLGSIILWRDAEFIGGKFYSFWRNNIERDGDVEFRKHILPHLSEEWRDNYEMQDRSVCPHDWKSMVEAGRYEDIANVLIGLEKTINPASRRWGLGSISGWTAASGELWGLSLYSFWRNKIERDGDELFMERILPHLPEEWGNKYEMRDLNSCPYDWKTMLREGRNKDIADILISFQKKTDPASTRWGLGSFSSWTAASGELWGHCFYSFWRKNIEKDGDKEFRERILPHMPEEWRDNYEMLSFCPHDWKSMVEEGRYKDVANILLGLEKKTDPASKGWCIRSISGWESIDNEPWGHSFVNYWTRNIEGDRAGLFREFILPHLPAEWGENFGKRSMVEWTSMAEEGRYEDIAEILISLNRKIDPALRKWGLGSIVGWTDEEGEPLGRSFNHFWRNNIERDGDELFRERILPHMPEEWRNNYEMRDQSVCPHDWKSMVETGRYEDIANVLIGLEKTINPASTRWGLGSVAHWIDVDGEIWGRSFYHYWRCNVEKNGDELFRERILPYMPEEWKYSYKMLGFRITFIEEDSELLELIEGTDDLDELQKLADLQGSKVAFDKLTVLLLKRFPALDIETAEWLINTHVPVVSVEVRTRVKLYFNVLYSPIRPDDSHKSTPEDRDVRFSRSDDTYDPDRPLLKALEAMGMEEEIIYDIIGLLEKHGSLEAILRAKAVTPEVYEAVESLLELVSG